MTTISLHNTMTRRKEAFAPLDPTNVRMYVCGPTVYDRAHLGNARPVVVFDVLYRLLRHVYGETHVTYVRNFTDVDDKIIRRAEESGRAIGEITGETTQWFLDDMAALGALEPTHMPRATEYIAQMIAMIEMLIANGCAYEAEGHVLFDVTSDPKYGVLSGRNLKDMIAGARVEVATYKRDPMDFVMWKPSSDDQPGWDGPVVGGKSIGRGRPGWHIECSAMSRALLGESFDIHGGGIDLMFPHHENEMAQSCCAHPEGSFAKVWLHNEMLQVEGQKMSKSLGNFFTVRDLLEGRGPGGFPVPGEVIRLVMLGTHYRKPMDWTAKKAREAEATLRKWRALCDGVAPTDVAAPVLAALADDLNTAGAVAELHKLAAAGDTGALKASAQMMGLLDDAMGDWVIEADLDSQVSALVDELLKARKSAREAEDWTRADLIRDGFKAAGIRINDTVTGVSWSIEKDEMDSADIFSSVRAANSSGSPKELERQLEHARRAGVYFADFQNLDVSPAWRDKPDSDYILEKLMKLKNNLEILK